MAGLGEEGERDERRGGEVEPEFARYEQNAFCINPCLRKFHAPIRTPLIALLCSFALDWNRKCDARIEKNVKEGNEEPHAASSRRNPGQTEDMRT